MVIERYKSGFEPPDSIPFEDLSSARNGDVSSCSGSGQQLHTSPAITDSPRGLTIKGTLSAAKFKKRGGIFGIFSGSKVGGSMDGWVGDMKNGWWLAGRVLDSNLMADVVGW